jgi:hypothetical protein
MTASGLLRADGLPCSAMRDRVISWNNPPRRRRPTTWKNVLSYGARRIRRLSKCLDGFARSSDLFLRKNPAKAIPLKDEQREFDRLSTATDADTQAAKVKPTFWDLVGACFQALLESIIR